MSGITIVERIFRGVTIIDIEGKVALGETNRQLHETIKRLVAEGKTQTVINLTKVTHIDSSGLGELVGGFTTLKANNGALKLFGMNDRVTDLMTITKLYTVFEIFDNELDAVYSFDVPEPTATTGQLNPAFDPELIKSTTIQ